MGKYCQLIMGPAGCGKSTYCLTMNRHFETIGRSMHLVNLDPAAEELVYDPSIDVRNLVNVENVMESFGYGPNGSLVYCMEYMVDNLNWLLDEIGDYENDYLIVDCPGQIELYSHIPVMSTIADALQRAGYHVCGVYLIDSHYVSDPSKFMAGVLSCLSAMIRIETPHINVLSKMDLLGDQAESEEMERYIDPDFHFLTESLNRTTFGRHKQLNEAIGQLLDDYGMVGFIPLNITDEESVTDVLQYIDNSIQWGEDEEPRTPKDLSDDEQS